MIGNPMLAPSHLATFAYTARLFCLQLMVACEKRDGLVEAAKVLEVKEPDFNSLETAAKDLAHHKSKWDLLGDFRNDRISWMTLSV